MPTRKRPNSLAVNAIQRKAGPMQPGTKRPDLGCTRCRTDYVCDDCWSEQNDLWPPGLNQQ